MRSFSNRLCHGKSLFYIYAFASICLLLYPSTSFAADKETMIILSFDGMRHDLAQNYIENEKMPNLKKIKENGIYAKNMKTVTPSLTATAHASIATGAKPEKTDFVSNQFHYEKIKVTTTEDAFKENIDVTPLWREAKKQGKVTATVGFPGSNPKKGQEADYAIYYGEVWEESKLDKLAFKEAKNWKNEPRSFSAKKEAHLTIKLQNAKNHSIHILAVDSKDNEVKDYDQFYFSEDLTIDEDDIAVKANEWAAFPLKVTEKETAGFWFKLKGVNKDLSSANLFRTAVTSGLIDGPEGFAADIKNKFGFFPDQDDTPALDRGWITRKEYEEISERFVNWTTDVSLYIKQEYEPDLLMFYAPHIDHEEHEFLLTDPRQPGYSQQAVKQNRKYIDWAYQHADQVIGKTLHAADSNDRLMIVSDHGMEPVYSTLSPNYELKKAGLLQVDKKGKVDIAKSKAYTVASGSMAHVYINLKGREKEGTVAPEEYEHVQHSIVNAFKDIEDDRKLSSKKQLSKYHFNRWKNSTEKDGPSWNLTKDSAVSLYKVLADKKEKPYAQIVQSDDEKAKNLNHPNTGDVVLFAAAGYNIDNDMSIGVKPAVERGSHGGDANRKELQPVFFAYSQDFKPAVIKRDISTLDIAPTVYQLMNLDAPSFIDGKAIKEFSEK